MKDESGVLREVVCVLGPVQPPHILFVMSKLVFILGGVHDAQKN